MAAEMVARVLATQASHPTKVIKLSDVSACPVKSLSSAHYLPDGTCLHSLFEPYNRVGFCEAKTKRGATCGRQPKWVSGEGESRTHLCTVHRNATLRFLESGGKMRRP